MRDLVEITRGDLKMLCLIDEDLPPLNEDGTLTVSVEVVDVLEPPDSRARFLHYMKTGEK